ncbi:MAG: hypothetical protein AAF206_14795 [Bacteroidota bacterium]
MEDGKIVIFLVVAVVVIGLIQLTHAQAEGKKITPERVREFLLIIGITGGVLLAGKIIMNLVMR